MSILVTSYVALMHETAESGSDMYLHQRI